MVVGAAVAHHAHRAHGQQHREGLPDLVVEASLADLVEVDHVGLAQDVEFLAADGAGDADGEARSGEGVAAHEGLGQAQLAAQRPHLVLEEFAQGLHELHVHALGQAAHVVMALDGDRGPAREGDALDHVGVKGALGEEGGGAASIGGDLAGLGLEHVDEELADGLALGLGVADPVQRVDEHVAGVHMDQRNVEGVAEEGDDLGGLALAHQAMVHEDAGQPLADGLVDQHRRHGGIDAARQAAEHPALLAHLGANGLDGLAPEGGHGPVALEARDLVDEIGDQLRPIGRMHDFEVELHRVVAPRLIGDGGHWGVLGHGDSAEARRQLGHPVAVAHPHGIALARLPDALKQGGGLGHLKLGAAKLAVMPRLDLAAQLHGHDLLAIADAQHGDPGVEDGLRGARGALVGHRAGTAREDHRLGLELGEGAFGGLEGRDLAIDAGLAHPPRDELGHLRAEIDDQHLVVVLEDLVVEGIR